MLVVVSDLHLTDGSSGDTINAGAFRVFVDALKRRAHSACWRGRDGDAKFVPIPRCDLVLLGDVFDVIRSARWLRSDALRPWAPGAHRAAFAGLIGEITDGILAHNAGALKHFRDLGGKLRIPTPAPGEHVEIPLHIHYLVGNHDWFYHLADVELTPIRKRIVEGLSLATPADLPFPHMIDEAGGQLQDLLLAHRLYVQHGDIYDSFNYEQQHGRDYSSLGDCIVIELLNRFPHEVQRSLGLDDDEPLIQALREIDNIRPLLAIPRWVESMLRRHAEPPLRERVMAIWNDMVEHFLALPFVRDHDRPFRMDTVDLLEAALLWSAKLRLGTLSRFSNELERLSKGESLAKYAVEEAALRDRRAQMVVYGHTHHPETVAIDVVQEHGQDVEQIYFNSGTWRRVHEPCIAHPDQLEFTKSHVMSYLAFYRDDERTGQRFESWTGQLG